MDRNLALALAFAVTYLLFSFTYARTPSDLPGNDFTSFDDRLADWSNSDTKATATNTIILPSENPESKPATVVEFDSEETENNESKLPEKEIGFDPEETENAETKLPEKEIGTTETIHEKSETESVKKAPLTVITYRPISRNFPRRPFIPFRRGHRCHGRRHHHNQFKPWGGSRFSGHREVSYGKDINISGKEDLGFDPVSREVPREISVRWAKFNHDGNRFSFINDERRKEILKRRDHHHDHDNEHKEEGEDREEEHEHEGIFMKGIRKFLNHF